MSELLKFFAFPLLIGAQFLGAIAVHRMWQGGSYVAQGDRAPDAARVRNIWLSAA